MSSDYAWLSTSLFCSKKHWHIVLTKGIQSFLCNRFNKKHIKAYQIKLNYHSGPNIRFSLLADTTRALYLAEELDAFFTGFFAAHQFSEQDWPVFNSTLFSNFPANTIQYGLYTTPGIFTHEDLHKFRFETKYAQLIITLAGDDPIDDDKIITIAFYLHIAWLKTHMLYHPELTAETYAGFYTIHRAGMESNSSNKALLSNYFENNKQQLIEIYNDIIQQPTDKLPDWLQKWVRICISELRSRNEHFNPTDGSAEDIYKRISNIITTHFGLSHYMQSLLFHSVVTAISTRSPGLPC